MIRTTALASAEYPPANPAPGVGDRAADRGRPRARVLIIDDDPAVAAGLALLLELDGRIVRTHTSLITVPLEIRSIDPDIILLDLSMPALSGPAFLNAGGRRMLRTDAPLVLFSGRSRDELARLARELGADGFISKGDELQEIVSQIDSWIQHRRELQTSRGESLARTISPSPAPNRSRPAIADRDSTPQGRLRGHQDRGR
jgi:DNA-binding NarL/FixJ family response regulator